MSWTTQFLLGRPGYEIPFDVNPLALSIKDTSLAVRVRNLAGDLTKSTIKTLVPQVTIHTDYLTVTQRNLISALSGTQDTFLSFMTRNDWQISFEPNQPISSTVVNIQNSSILKLDTTLTLLSLIGNITINGVYTVPSLSGTNYYTGGFYGGLGSLTLGTPLPSPGQVYVCYTYKGWLVDLQDLSYEAKAGQVDVMSGDFTLTGV